MKELELLQDICLDVYGVSLADIAIEEFERLDAVIWAMSVVRKALLDDTKVFAEPATLNCTCSCHERGFDICPVNCCDQLNECPVCDNLYETCCDNCGFEDIHAEREKSYCDIWQCPEDSDCRTEKAKSGIICCNNCNHLYDTEIYGLCPTCTEQQEQNVVYSLSKSVKTIECTDCGHKFEPYKCPVCGYEKERFEGLSKQQIKTIDCGNCGNNFDLNKHGGLCPNCGYEELPF